MIKIGINGLGRIGRAIFRVNQVKKFFDVVVINDINPDIDNIAYTLNYDTLYGRQDHIFKSKVNCLINEKGDSIAVQNQHHIYDVDWGKYDVDYIIDASGVLDNVDHARNLIEKDIIKRVFVTHSPENVDFTMVLGANEEKLNINKHKVISSSICDATALGPVLNTINKNFGIEGGYVTTLHPWLNYQNLMDGPSTSWSVPGEIYHHYALGRSVNGLSSTTPAMLGSRSACNRAVTEPIDLPQSATVLTLLSFLRCSIIVATSSLSYQPSDINSPPLHPHPEKSKQKSVIFWVKRYWTFSRASSLQEELPCI